MASDFDLTLDTTFESAEALKGYSVHPAHVAVADGEAKITALSPSGRYAVCSVVVGLAGDKYDTEEDLADELKLPDPYVAVRLNRLS